MREGVSVLIFISIAFIVATSGCLKMMGVTQEELEELGLSESPFFSFLAGGVKKKVVTPEKKIEAPKYVGMDILLIEYPKSIIPGSIFDMTVVIGNNYYGSTAGNVVLTVRFPPGFNISVVDAATQNITLLPEGNPNVAVIKYDKIDYNEGDVITLTVKAPPREVTGSIRDFWKIDFSLTYWYSTFTRLTTRITSTSYYRNILGVENITPIEVKRMAGELSIYPELEKIGRGPIKIPDSVFGGGGLSFPKVFTFRFSNDGKGIVLGNVTFYFIGIRREGFITTEILTGAGIWKEADRKDLQKLSSLGLEMAHRMLLDSMSAGYPIYKAEVSPWRKKIVLPVNMKDISSSLKNTLTEFPVLLLAVYQYEIDRTIYILMEKQGI